MVAVVVVMVVVVVVVVVVVEVVVSLAPSGVIVEGTSVKHGMCIVLAVVGSGG